VGVRGAGPMGFGECKWAVKYLQPNTCTQMSTCACLHNSIHLRMCTENNIWSNINKYHQFDVSTVRVEKAYKVLLYICSTQSQFNRTSLPLNI